MNAQLDNAILATVAYGDVFDFPLTAEEIHRFLIGRRASLARVVQSLNESPTLAAALSCTGPYICLAGREGTGAVRARRRAVAARAWPRALRYGRAIARLPYVRMVAVTGSLAMDNTDEAADLDFLIVTRPGRLWLARACVILLVRRAARASDRICPNYFLSERALALEEQNLFTAHELAQMVTLHGAGVYAAMWRANPWVARFLPNAAGHLAAGTITEERPSWTKGAAEALLSAPPGSWAEGWEMRRKLARFGERAAWHPEACFDADRCKGHFDDHGGRILRAYAERLRALELVPA